MRWSVPRTTVLRRNSSTDRPLRFSYSQIPEDFPPLLNALEKQFTGPPSYKPARIANPQIPHIIASQAVLSAPRIAFWGAKERIPISDLGIARAKVGCKWDWREVGCTLRLIVVTVSSAS
jgi:hypothetical protein